jgi:hypothetical protein
VKDVEVWVAVNTPYRTTKVDAPDFDAWLGKSVVERAGLDKGRVSALLRATIPLDDGTENYLRVYFFLDGKEKVLGHYFVTWEEIAALEKAPDKRG